MCLRPTLIVGAMKSLSVSSARVGILLSHKLAFFLLILAFDKPVYLSLTFCSHSHTIADCHTITCQYACQRKGLVRSSMLQQQQQDWRMCAVGRACAWQQRTIVLVCTAP